MNKKITVIFFLLVAAFALAINVHADENCTTNQYGTTTCNPLDVTIDKEVKNPISGVWVENLLAGDPAYSPNSNVSYKLRLINDSAQDFTDVKVTDILPDRFVHASVDNRDLVKEENFSGKELTFKLKDTFRAHTTVEIYVTAKVADKGAFSDNKNLYCGDADKLQNNAKLKAGDRPETQDSSSVCVQTSVLGTTTLPKAGPEDYLPLLPYLGLGATGIALLIKRKN